jgi:hypothetical protein
MEPVAEDAARDKAARRLHRLQRDLGELHDLHVFRHVVTAAAADASTAGARESLEAVGQRIDRQTADNFQRVRKRRKDVRWLTKSQSCQLVVTPAAGS